MVDALATLVAMFRVNRKTNVQPIQMSVYDAPMHYLNMEKETNGKPWYYDIFQYLKSQQYVENISKNDKRTLKRFSIGFFSDGDILYKRGEVKYY